MINKNITLTERVKWYQRLLPKSKSKIGFNACGIEAFLCDRYIKT